jgi:hypothetical protein
MAEGSHSALHRAGPGAVLGAVAGWVLCGLYDLLYGPPLAGFPHAGRDYQPLALWVAGGGALGAALGLAVSRVVWAAWRFVRQLRHRAGQDTPADRAAGRGC